MSTVSTRHRVQQVEAAPEQSGASVRGAAVAAGLLTLLGAAARSLYRSMTAEQAAGAAALPAGAPLAAGEREKLEALVELRAAPIAAGNLAAIEAQARALMNVRAPAEARALHLEFRKTLAESGRQVLASSVALCCRRAAVELGFTPIDAPPGTANGLPLRIASADAAGRGIVTEIRAAEDGAVTMQTEAVGMTDDACVGIIERYEKLLGQYGVHSEAPRRHPTGGIAETRAARAFAGRRLRPQAKAPGADEAPRPRHRGAERVKQRG